MERRFCPPENHPLLLAFNFMTMVIGTIMAFQATLVEFIDQSGRMNSIFLIGMLLMFLGIHTGKLTMNFRHWDYGLTAWQKLFASTSIFFGALTSGWVILNLFFP